MSSQLNPDAKEFVPTTPPPHSASPKSPMANTNGGIPPSFLSSIENDSVIAQSPRKGVPQEPMDNIQLPSENDFDEEISSRPHEVEDEIENSDLVILKRSGSSSSQASYQEMNLKEAMHGDEKVELAAEIEDRFVPQNIEDNSMSLLSGVTNTDEEQIVFDNEVISESDPMNMSFYQDKTNEEGTNPFDLNAVQTLPIDDEEELNGFHKDGDDSRSIESPMIIEGQQGERFVIEDVDFGMMHSDDKTPDLISPSSHQMDFTDEISKPEEDMYSPVSENKFDDLINSMNSQNLIPISTSFEKHEEEIESDKPESELIHELTSPIVQAVQEMTSEVTSLLTDVTNSFHADEEQFEAESFVENIKSLESQDKYTDSGLSPTVMEFTPILTKTLDSLPESLISEEEKQSPIEDSAESDICLRPEEILIPASPQSTEPQYGSYTTPIEPINILTTILKNDEETETPPSTPANVDNIEIHQRLETPEPEVIAEAMEKIVETIIEPIVEAEPNLIIDEVKSELAPDVIVPAIAAAAAAAVLVTATKTEKSAKSKVSDVKKSDVKPKPATKAPITSARTTSAPIKKSTTLTATRTSAPTKTPISPRPATAAPAKPPPIARPRSSPLAPLVKPAIEKKTTTTSAVTATKKTSLTNGDVKPAAVKRTSGTAPVRTVSSARPALSSTTTTTTTTKPATARSTRPTSTLTTAKPATTTTTTR